MAPTKHDTIISEFEKKYGHLKEFGLKINGVANLIDTVNVISISTPFIFDRTQLPKNFMGLDIRNGTVETDLPLEFRGINPGREYIWAYQRFEIYVDKHSDLIRKTLKQPDISREKMLDALCFGDFNAHRLACIEWEEKGTIPKWNNKYH